MMSTASQGAEYHAAFLQDICSVPEDDTPRLIYADWLEDAGDPERAEFIRLQCQLPLVQPDDPSLSALKNREADLLHRNGRAWRQHLPAWLRCGVYFGRGLLDRFDGPASAFFRGDISDFFNQAPAAALTLHGITSQQLRTLCASPHICRVRSLDLINPKPMNRMASRLIEGLNLREAIRLTELGLVGLGLSALDLALLLENRPGLERLERLTLVDCRMRNFSLQPLLKWEGLNHLRLLDVSENELSESGIAELNEVMGMRVRIGKQYPWR